MEGILKTIPFLKLLKGKCKAEEKPQIDQASVDMIAEIRRIEKSLENARGRFDLYTDSDLIDAAIMEIDALEKRYAFLIKEAKKTKIVAFQA